MDQINKKQQLSIRQRKSTLTKSANDDLKDFLNNSSTFEPDTGPQSRALNSTQKSPTYHNPLPSLTPQLDSREDPPPKPNMLNKSIDIPRVDNDPYRLEDLSSFPQSRTHIYFRRSMEHQKKPQFLSKLNPMHTAGGGDLNEEKQNNPLRRSGSFNRKKKSAARTVFLQERGSYLSRMNNQHLMTFLKKKISLKGGNFEFQPHQERSNTGFMLTSHRVSPQNCTLQPPDRSERRELEEKLVLENRFKATEGSGFKVSRLNQPVMPLPPQVRENILSKNIKNHTFYFSDKWTHGMSEEREGFAQLFDQLYEQGSFLPQRKTALSSPYHRDLRDHFLEGEILESKISHLLKMQDTSIAEERCSSVFTNETIKGKFTPVQEESDSPQDVYGGGDARRGQRSMRNFSSRRKEHSYSQKKLGLDLDMLIRQNIMDEHKRKLRLKTPSYASEHQGSKHRLDHHNSSEVLGLRSKKDAMTSTSRPSRDLKERSVHKSELADSNQQLVRPSSQLSHILYSSPEEKERRQLDIKEMLQIPFIKKGISGSKNVIGLMKKISKAQLAHSMAFNLQQNMRRNNLTKMNLYDKSESYRTVGVMQSGAQKFIIPSSFFQRKYSRDQRKPNELSLRSHSFERGEHKRKDLVEQKQQEKELKVLQNQVLIEHYFEHEPSQKQREIAFNNLVKHFTSRFHKEGSREILKFLKDNEDLFLADSS